MEVSHEGMEDSAFTGGASEGGRGGEEEDAGFAVEVAFRLSLSRFSCALFVAFVAPISTFAAIIAASVDSESTVAAV